MVFRAGCKCLFLGGVLLSVSILIAMNLHNQVSFIAGTVIGRVSQCLWWQCYFGDCISTWRRSNAWCIFSWYHQFDSVVYCNKLSDSKLSVWCSFILYRLFVANRLLPLLYMSILLTSLFLIGEKWLIIEPKSPKNIYRILKFATSVLSIDSQVYMFLNDWVLTVSSHRSQHFLFYYSLLFSNRQLGTIAYITVHSITWSCTC